MYAPPADRTSPWLAQLARLQAARHGMPQPPFAQELAAVRNEVAHLAAAGPMAPRATGGLVRRSRLQALG